MSILDWFAQPTCEELAALVAILKDPFAYLDTDGGEGPVFMTQIGGAYTGTAWQSFDYDVHPGWPSLFTPAGAFKYDPVNAIDERAPQRRIVSRAVLTNPTEVIAAARLVKVYYTTPNALRLCPAAQGWFHARGRVRALDGIRAFGAGYGFGPDTAPAVTEMLLKVFDAAAGSKAGSRETEVIYAAAQIVLESRTAVLDAATWLPLWRWALGGPSGAAAVRTRVMAMKALQAILRRNALTPRQVLMAASMADVLQQLVAQRAESLPAAERAFFLSEAASLVGAVTDARYRAAAAEGLPPGDAITPPSTSGSRAGWWIAAGVVGVAAAVGAALHHRRQAGARWR